jgi:hypothetical protein
VASLTPQAIRSARWRKSHPQESKRRERTAHLKRRYGYTLEFYEAQYEKQEGKCAICGQHKAVLDVDHCHETNAFRGLLCHRCNWAIGILGDDADILQQAANYLRKH